MGAGWKTRRPVLLNMATSALGGRCRTLSLLCGRDRRAMGMGRRCRSRPTRITGLRGARHRVRRRGSPDRAPAVYVSNPSTPWTDSVGRNVLAGRGSPLISLARDPSAPMGISTTWGQRAPPPRKRARGAPVTRSLSGAPRVGGAPAAPRPWVSRKTRPVRCPVKGRQPGHHATPSDAT